MPDVKEINVVTGEVTTRDFTQEEIAANQQSAAALPPVPQIITPTQGLIWLQRAGKYAQVKAFIEDGTDVELQIWWARATEWRRDNQYIVGLASGFGINLDTAFTEAAQIV